MNTPVMTIGDLARRTGVPAKVLRRHHDLGLIYGLGRSRAGYRLFDEHALWCVGVITTLRALGLSEAEIRQLAATCDDAAWPVGPQLAELLARSRTRIEARIRDVVRRTDAVETDSPYSPYEAVAAELGYQKDPTLEPSPFFTTVHGYRSLVQG